jgi:hypothetical protein
MHPPPTGLFLIGWLILATWALVRWQHMPHRGGGAGRAKATAAFAAVGAAAAAASSDPLVHLVGSSLPACWRATTAAAWLVELCLYDAGLGAAGLWLMGARWWQWVGLYWAWAAASIWLHTGSGGAEDKASLVIRSCSNLRRWIKAGGDDARKGEAAACGSSGGVATGAALLQLGVPLFLGWVVPWL